MARIPVGTKFGRLTVTGLGNSRGKAGYPYKLICDCGNKTEVFSTPLLKGLTRSCGCLRKQSAVATMKANQMHGNVWDDARIGQLRKFVEAGKTDEEIAGHMGISETTVYKRMLQHAIKRPRGVGRYKKIEGAVAVKVMEMLAGGKLLREMAVVLNVSKSTIQTYFLDNNIAYDEAKELAKRQGKWPPGLRFEDVVPSVADGRGRVPRPVARQSLMGCSAAECVG